MLSRALETLSQYQKQVALSQAAVLDCENAKIVENLVEYDGDGEKAYLAVYKCECGALIAEDEEVGELGACYKCGANYLGLDRN